MEGEFPSHQPQGLAVPFLCGYQFVDDQQNGTICK